MEKHYVHNIPAARRLRKPQTPTEALLWEELRDRRLDGHKFRRQHAVGPYVLDFYCSASRCAVEIDGGIHNDPAQRVRDIDRQAAIEKTGIWFVRITASDIERNLPGVLAGLAAQLARHSPDQ